MFPNPQDALPLPPQPNLERCKKLAKDLIKACRSGDPDAIGEWAARWVTELATLQGQSTTPQQAARLDRTANQVEEFTRRKLADSKLAGRKCVLADAQFVIARSHGFASWSRFAKHIEALSRANSSVSAFEAAADAIISGGESTLRRLLSEQPELIRARATREHRATLLHYVSANGVESYRQKTPNNAVEIAEILLDSGADVDATADVYGGGWTTLGLVATSYHPMKAGVQNALIELLIDRGAAIDGAPRGHGLVLECLANGCPGAAEFLADRGAPLDLEAAAALGRLEAVKGFFTGAGILQHGATTEQMRSAFFWACGFGFNDVVEFLLQRGADLNAPRPGDQQTPLHWAIVFGQVATVELLLRHKAQLEAVNVYGGTVLGQALWSAAHGGDPDAYVQIIETLIAAGAEVPERHPPINERIDQVLQRHRSQADDALWWYGEKPRRR